MAENQNEQTRTEAEQIYMTNSFLEKVYEDSRAKTDLLRCPDEEIEEYKKNIKTNLKACLCISEMDQAYGCQLEYKKESEFVSYGVTVEKYFCSAIRLLPFPVYVIKPENPNGRSVLYCHGHDDLGIMGALLERYDKVRYHKNLPILLAKEGFTVVAPEFAGFGDSDYFGFPEGKQPRGGCFAHMAFLTLAGYSIGGLRVLQAIKTLDLMEAMGHGRDILGFGVSGGGMVAEYLGILDERISAMAISCYASLYRNSILYKEHCVDNYVPGILKVGESHEILSAFAPKPLLTINGDRDRAFPVAGTNIAFPFLKKVYERVGGDYTGIIFEGKHEINPEEVLRWFAKQV